jgi:two-component system chemotaxis sensor kinase CheA
MEVASIEADVQALRADEELASMFFAEALDHLGTIEATVLELETTPGNVKLLNDLFRPFHTVKGNAGALGVTSIQELAHTVENLLDLCRSGRHEMGSAETDAVLKAVDVLTAMLQDLRERLAGGAGRSFDVERRALIEQVQQLVEKAATTTVPEADTATPAVETARGPAPAATVAKPTTHRPVAIAAVDLARVTPTHRPAAPAVPAAATPAPVTDNAPRDAARRRPEDVAAQVKVDTRKLDNLVDMVGELVIVGSIIQEDPTLRAADQALIRHLAQLRRITSDLQRTAMSMRMVPIRQTFQKMARLVRDLTRKSGKVVELTLSGEDTELDRRVVEDINDPLMHMIRNSLDHGIEPSGERVRCGKPAEGHLSLRAYHQGGNIVIAIEDDGAGLNTEKILAKAIAQGIVSEEHALSAGEIHQLVFKPGFSTADQVTEISGRGVGMDVVRRNIEALRGRIEIQTAPGKGTTFLIRLPLTLAILDGLILAVGNQRYVLPTFSVRESLRPRPDQVHEVQGAPRVIQVRNSLIPLVRLADHFGLPPPATDLFDSTVIVVEDEQRRIGLVVDELVGMQEVVIKSLGNRFAHVRGVAGGAILGDGHVGLILDAHGIVASIGPDAARAA